MSCFCGRFRPSRVTEERLATKALVEAEAQSLAPTASFDPLRYHVPTNPGKEACVEAVSPLLSPDHMSGTTGTGLMNDFSLNESFTVADQSSHTVNVDVWAIAYSIVMDLVDSACVEAVSPLMCPHHISDTITEALLNESMLTETFTEQTCPAAGSWSTGYSIVNIVPLSTNDFTADWGSHVLTGRTDGLRIPEAKLGETGISLSGDLSPNLNNLKWCNGQGWSRIEH